MSGVEFSSLYLAQHLDAARYKPLVICPTEGDLPNRCRESNIPFAFVPVPRFHSTGILVFDRVIPNPLAILANLAALVRGARPLARFLRDLRSSSGDASPVLILTKGMLAHFLGGLAARWARIPCVWHIQDRVSNRAGPLYAWTLALVGRLLAQQIIVDADSIARQLVPIVPRDRVHTIWNGVDTHEFSPQIDGAGVRAEWKLSPQDQVIGMAGRLTRWKGQHLLLRAFARLAPNFPNAYVALIGASLFDTDHYVRELRSLVDELGLRDRVIFAGFRWDMPQVFAALDVVAHPSLDKDSSPLAVVSAMASGKVIVCASVDGTAQLFEDGKDGLLFPPGDAAALADKLELVLCDADLRARLGCAARAKAEHELSVEKFAFECEKVFDRALP